MCPILHFARVVELEMQLLRVESKSLHIYFFNSQEPSSSRRWLSFVCSVTSANLNIPLALIPSSCFILSLVEFLHEFYSILIQSVWLLAALCSSIHTLVYHERSSPWCIWSSALGESENIWLFSEVFSHSFDLMFSRPSGDPIYVFVVERKAYAL